MVCANLPANQHFRGANMVSSSITLTIEEVTAIEWALRKMADPSTLGVILHARFLDFLCYLIEEETHREDPSSIEDLKAQGGVQ
jgi:hypothetical protein